MKKYSLEFIDEKTGKGTGEFVEVEEDQLSDIFKGWKRVSGKWVFEENDG